MGDFLSDSILKKKLKALIKDEEQKQRVNTGLIIALAIVGALAIIGAAAYLFLRLTGRLCYVDDYDLYDDLDNYYEDDDDTDEIDDSNDFAE